MDVSEQIDEEFSRVALLPEDQIDLARGALVIAKTEYPDLDESFYLERLNGMAVRLKNDVKRNQNPGDIIARMNRLLFDEEDFRGNRENYYEPDNSCLNRVLERKLGIPITLSLVYIEVGQRLGLDLRGIGLPGHFITALYHGAARTFIDPFNAGELRTVEDCREAVRAHQGEASAFDPRWLEPIGPKEFLSRMLRNLKRIYAQKEDYVKAFRMIHWILTLQPTAPAELRERAMLYEAMGNPVRAAEDWERYLESAAGVESEATIRARIDDLRKQQSRIH
ncbi:MAG: transglutaminase family protein [Desulfobacterales bacterium]|nr:MAG: transglutaminase family protein [Desulfobacterales bacterium]